MPILRGRERLYKLQSSKNGTKWTMLIHFPIADCQSSPMWSFPKMRVPLTRRTIHHCQPLPFFIPSQYSTPPRNYRGFVGGFPLKNSTYFGTIQRRCFTSSGPSMGGVSYGGMVYINGLVGKIPETIGIFPSFFDHGGFP